MDTEAAAIELAVQLGALERCSTCEETWSTDEVDPEDSEAVDELVSAALKRIDRDADLDVFDDGDELRSSLVAALADAPAEQECSH